MKTKTTTTAKGAKKVKLSKVERMKHRIARIEARIKKYEGKIGTNKERVAAIRGKLLKAMAKGVAKAKGKAKAGAKKAAKAIVGAPAPKEGERKAA